MTGSHCTYILTCGFCSFVLFLLFYYFFFLKRKKHNQGNLYDSVGIVGERERSEVWKANKKWVLNHMEQSRVVSGAS